MTSKTSTRTIKLNDYCETVRNLSPTNKKFFLYLVVPDDLFDEFKENFKENLVSQFELNVGVVCVTIDT